MFEAKDEITDAVKRVVAFLGHYQRGQVAPWGAIEQAAQFVRYSEHWSAFVRRLKREVRQTRGITLQAVPGVGWKLETTSEQLHARSIRRQQRATRQLSMDITETQCLPDAELTQHQRQTKYRKIDHAKATRRSVLYSLRLGHQLAKPTTTGIPRTKPPTPPQAA